MLSNLRRSNARSFLPPSGSSGDRLARLALGLPLVLMLGAVTILTLYCRGLLLEAVAGQPVSIGSLPLLLVAGAFLFASAAVILLQSVRVAGRVAGPELRLLRAMQRIRTGDISFRINLRRGDLLSGLARECNELLDWLNANPPRGAQTGGDIVRMEEVATSEVLP